MSTATVAVSKPASGFIPWLKHLGSMFKVGAEKAIAIETKLLPGEEAAIQAVGLAATAAGQPAIAAGAGIVGVSLQRLFGVAVQVEQISEAVGASAGTGAQKLAAALPQMEQTILSDPIFRGKTISNLDLWNQSIEAITSAIVGLGNSVSVPPAPQTTPGSPAPAAPAA